MRTSFALILLLAAFACLADARPPSRELCTKRPQLDEWSDFNTTPGNMRPLKCARGWQTLNPARPADKAILDAFLEAEFASAQQQLKRARDAARYCAAGVESAAYSGYFLGCIIRGARADDVQAQGVVTYTCKGSSKVLKLGLNAEGTYAC
ncbi:hypothetical protein ABPG75_011953 [Micractinium tetrahymenae]